MRNVFSSVNSIPILYLRIRKVTSKKKVYGHAIFSFQFLRSTLNYVYFTYDLFWAVLFVYFFPYN